MNSSWNWDDFFLFYWLMRLWDWTFGTSGKGRRSKCRSEYKNRRGKRRGSRGKGHDASIGLLADIYAAFIILPFVLLFASMKESKEERRQAVQARRSARSAARAQSGSSTTRKADTTKPRPAAQPRTQSAFGGQVAASQRAEQQTQQAQREARHRQTMQTIRDDTGPDREYAAMQQRQSAQEKARKDAEKAEKLEREAKARTAAIEHLTLPLTSKYTADAAMLEASKAIAEAEGDRGVYLGLFEVSYLMSSAEDIVINAAVKGDNLSRSINLSNFPEEVQKAVSDYIAAGGSTQGYTKKNWVNEEAHTLKVAVYLQEPKSE